MSKQVLLWMLKLISTISTIIEVLIKKKFKYNLSFELTIIMFDKLVFIYLCIGV